MQRTTGKSKAPQSSSGSEDVDSQEIPGSVDVTAEGKNKIYCVTESDNENGTTKTTATTTKRN